MTGPFRSDESAAVPRFAPTGTAPQRPKADPNPDYGFDGRIRPAPVPHTEGEKAFTGRLACPDCGASLRFVSGQDDLQCPDCGTGKGNK